MPQKNKASQESILFWTLIALNFLYYLYLILSKRLSLGHDGFTDLAVAYYFLNGVVNYGEIPQWVPFLTHGTNATSLFVIHNTTGIFSNVLLLFGFLLKGINFLPLFYIGLFVDELLLIVGVWLLARRFFTSPLTIFLVASAATFSVVPMTDINFTLRFFYAIPLILHFVHSFLETRRWAYLFLAGYLFLFQLLTMSLYYMPVVLLTIIAYFIFYTIFRWRDVFSGLKSLKFPKTFFLCVLALSACLLFTFLFIKAGERENLTLYAVERNADSSVSLHNFLTYGGRVDLSKFRELFLRSSKELEITLYSGLLTLMLMTLSVFTAVRRHNAHFYALSVLLMLFSSGTIVAQWLYHFWPLMKYYRHIGMVDVITKLFFCFMAGFGFEAFFINRLSLRPKIFTSICAGVALAFVGAHFGILSMVGKYPQGFRMEESSVYALIYACLFLMFGLIRLDKNQKLLIFLLLSVHTIDTYSYKVTEGILRSFPLNQKQYDVFKFTPIVYTPRREEKPSEVRAREIILDTPAGKEIDHRAMYWKLDAFLFRDGLVHNYRVDHALKDFDQYLKGATGKDLNDESAVSAYYHNKKMIFPHNVTAYQLSGGSLDKLQLFSNAYRLDAPKIGQILYDGKFRGGMLLVPEDSIPKKKGYNLDPFVSNTDLGQNDRLFLIYNVEKFSPNQIDIRIVVPEEQKKAFLYYSDVWHRRWKAFVDGYEVPVFKANLAYKAIPVGPGENKITFRFFSWYVALLYLINNLNALFWFGAIIYSVVFISRSSSNSTFKTDRI